MQCWQQHQLWISIPPFQQQSLRNETDQKKTNRGIICKPHDSSEINENTTKLFRMHFMIIHFVIFFLTTIHNAVLLFQSGKKRGGSFRGEYFVPVPKYSPPTLWCLSLVHMRNDEALCCAIFQGHFCMQQCPFHYYYIYSCGRPAVPPRDKRHFTSE